MRTTNFFASSIRSTLAIRISSAERRGFSASSRMRKSLQTCGARNGRCSKSAGKRSCVGSESLEEELDRRDVQAAEAAAKEAARQSILAHRQAPGAINRRMEEAMTDEARLVQQRDAMRLALLKRMWERSQARTNVGMDRDSLFEDVGANRQDGEAAARWLVEEGLAGFIGQMLKIEHAGIKEVEDAIRDPKSRTEHFTPPVISMANTFNIHGSTIGALQIGNDATANVQQNIGAMPEQLVELFAQLRREVDALPDPAQRAEIVEVVDDLEKEARQEKRNEFRLKALSTALTGVNTLLPIVKMILGVLGVHIAT